MSVERIQLQPEEIVELVEERLAWLAVASEGGHSYWQRFYRRAVPTVRLGPGAAGYIDVAGVLAGDLSDEGPLRSDDKHVANMSRSAKANWPKLGEALQYAELIDTDPRADTVVRVCDSKLAELTAADVVHADTFGRYRSLEVRGVRYHLQAFGLLGKAEARTQLARTRFAQMPAVVYQEVTQLENGKSVSDAIVLVRLSNGKLAMPSTGVTLDAYWRKSVAELTPEERATPSFGWDRDENGDQVHPLQTCFDTFIMWQFARRRDWTIEFSLGKDRTGLGLATDAIGARELAHAMRLDGGARASRRKALLHWVRDHMRRRRDGSAAQVRAHLRGEREFQAGPYWTTIWPSREDIERTANPARFEESVP